MPSGQKIQRSTAQINAINETATVVKQTLADAIAACLAGDVAVGNSVEWRERVPDSGHGGNVGRLMDAGTAASRPTPDEGEIIHVGGEGLWLKGLFPDGRYTLRRFGISDNQDATVAIQKILNAGKELDIDGLKGIRISNPVAVTDLDVSIKGSGSLVIDYTNHPFGFAPLTFIYSLENTTSVTGLSTVDYDFGNGPTRVSALSVSDSSGFFVGDTVKVTSDDQIPWLDPSDGQLCGSAHVIGAVDVGIIYFLDVCYLPFSSNIQVSKFRNNKELKINGDISFQRIGEASNGDRFATIRIKGAYFANISNLKAKGLLGEFLHFEGCYGHKTNDISGFDLVTDITNNQFGYVIVERSSSYGSHTNITGVNVRHPYTNGAIFNVSTDDYSGHGCNEFAAIYNLNAINCTSSGVDTHPESYQTTFFSPLVSYPNRGVNGALWSAQLRGVEDCIQGGLLRGGDGVLVRKEFAHDRLCEGIVISGLEYRGKQGERIIAPLRVMGLNESKVRNTKIFDVKLSHSESLNILEAENAEISIRRSHGQCLLSSESTSSVYKINNCNLKSLQNEFDLSESSATNYRFGTLVDDGSDLVSIDDSLTVGNSSFAILADFNSNDGVARFYEFETDKAPSFVNPGANRGAGAIFRWSYSVERGQLAGSNYLNLVKTTNFSLNGNRIEEQTAEQIFVEVDLSGVSGLTQLTGFPAGNRVGQMLSISLKEGAAFDLQINASSNLQRSTPIVLKEGEMASFRWSPSGKWAG